jgi:DNA-directed RNA polymerase subunit RPC12/RpoP
MTAATCRTAKQQRADSIDRCWAVAVSSQIKTFVEYRCRRVGLIFTGVDPAGTSIECPECHHKDKRSRLSQSDFAWARCHHIEHGDVAGGTNVRDRASEEDYGDIAGNFFKKCSPFQGEKRSTRGACMRHAEYLKNPPFTVGRLFGAETGACD